MWFVGLARSLEEEKFNLYVLVLRYGLWAVPQTKRSF